MYEGTSIGVVVPAYNEAGRVGTVIDTVPGYVDRTYVVDDRSTDGTWEEIRRRASRDADRATATAGSTRVDGGRRLTRDRGTEPAVTGIRHERNRGVGAAIKTGYRRARGDGVDVAAVMAGDGQMDPDQLDRVLDPVVRGRASYAKGNRLCDPSLRDGMPPGRYAGSVVLTYLTRVASGYWTIADPQNGYTAISLSVFDEIDLDELYDDYGFCNDLLVRLNVGGKRVAEVPMAAEYGDEQSHIDFASFVPQLSWLLLRGFLWRLWAKYVRGEDRGDVAMLYGVGAASSLAGLLSLAAPSGDEGDGGSGGGDADHEDRRDRGDHEDVRDRGDHEDGEYHEDVRDRGDHEDGEYHGDGGGSPGPPARSVVAVAGALCLCLAAGLERRASGRLVVTEEPDRARE